MYNFPCSRQPQNNYQYTQSFPLYPASPIGTALPTGIPAGTVMTPMPLPESAIPSPTTQHLPQTVTDTSYLPGFLRTQIGKRIKVQFLIGTTGPLVDRTGTLLGVGANYILMKPDATDDRLTADLYSIKFVDILL